MPLHFDPEYQAAAQPLIDALAAAPKFAAHDIITRREAVPAFFATLFDAAGFKEPPGVQYRRITVKSSDGYDISILHIYKAEKSTQPTAAIVHYHGGGMIMGDAEFTKLPNMVQVAQTGVPVFSVDYRLAPDHPHPVPVRDSYEALRWIQEHSADFNIDPARIAIQGESGGGGIAAGVALMARDKGLPGPPLAKQILIYPMLDNENVNPQEIEKFTLWSHIDNLTAWTAVLGKADPSAPKEYAAASRAETVEGLPPTYIDVGSLDLFRDEDILYAGRLLKAGVDTELHVYPGVPHAFEALAPGIHLTKTAIANRNKVITSL